MGLSNFEGKRIRKGDVTIAKNYLSEDELKELNRIVTMFLDYAEDRTKRHIPIYMKDWIDALEKFLRFNNIFEDEELVPSATIRKFRLVAEGNREVSRNVEYYNLKMILAIGYRVRSHVGNQFRRWASEVLTEYMKKDSWFLILPIGFEQVWQSLLNTWR